MKSVYSWFDTRWHIFMTGESPVKATWTLFTPGLTLCDTFIWLVSHLQEQHEICLLLDWHSVTHWMTGESTVRTTWNRFTPGLTLCDTLVWTVSHQCQQQPLCELFSWHTLKHVLGRIKRDLKWFSSQTLPNEAGYLYNIPLTMDMF